MTTEEAHLGLIRRVISQMGLRGDVADEAFSHSLVTVVEASRTFDPARNVSLAWWLGKNIRWSINHWLAAQHARPTVPFESVSEPVLEPSEAALELHEALIRVKAILTPNELHVTLGLALGYNGNELSKKLGVSPAQISRFKNSARRKLGDINQSITIIPTKDCP